MILTFDNNFSFYLSKGNVVTDWGSGDTIFTYPDDIYQVKADGDDLWVLTRRGELYRNKELLDECVWLFSVRDGNYVHLDYSTDLFVNGIKVKKGPFFWSDLSANQEILLVHSGIEICDMRGNFVEKLPLGSCLSAWFLPDGSILTLPRLDSYYKDCVWVGKATKANVSSTSWLLWDDYGQFYGSYNKKLEVEGIKAAAYGNNILAYIDNQGGIKYDLHLSN